MPLSVLQMSASQLVTLGPFVTHTFMLPRYSSPHSVTISNRSNVLCPRSQQNEYHPLYPAPWPFCIKLISHYIHSSLLTHVNMQISKHKICIACSVSCVDTYFTCPKLIHMSIWLLLASNCTSETCMIKEIIGPLLLKKKTWFQVIAYHI